MYSTENAHIPGIYYLFRVRLERGKGQGLLCFYFGFAWTCFRERIIFIFEKETKKTTKRVYVKKLTLGTSLLGQ